LEFCLLLIVQLLIWGRSAMFAQLKNSFAFTTKLFVVAAAVAAGTQASHTWAQSAYFSFEGDIPVIGDQHDFLFDLTRSVGSGEDLRFVTYTNSGGTNAAGDTIAATSFDGDLRLWDSLNVLHGQDDQSGPGVDSLLSWAGVQTLDTPLNPDPLVADSYRLNHQNYLNFTTGAWAVDLIGPADAMVYTGTTITGTGTTDSLKFGTSGAGANVATYNHSSGTLTLLDQLVLAPSGNAALNLSGGTITAGGLTTINSGGIYTQSNGTFNANGGMTIDGGTYQRTGGAFNLAAGQTLTAMNDGQFSYNTSYDIDAGTTFDIQSGADFVFSTYLDIGDNGGDGTLLVDGSGSSLVTGTAYSLWGYSGNTADITFSNNATGDIGEILLAQHAAAGTTGNFDVLSNADVTIDTLIIADSGGATTSGVVSVIDSGSTITQGAGSNLTIGAAADSFAALNAAFGGVFNASNTGTITVNATGSLNADSGTFNAKGSGSAAGGTISTSGMINVTGSGLVNLNGGTPGYYSSVVGGNGGIINVLAGSVNLSGSGRLLGNGLEGGSLGGYRGGEGGSASISGGAVSAVDSTQISFSGGNGGFGGGAGDAGRGGEGGTTTVSAGSLALHDSTILRLDGGNAGGTHLNPNRGGHGGTLDVSGGTVAVNDTTTVSLDGGNGSGANVSGKGGNAGNGGQVLVSAGSLTVNDGLLRLEAGNPGNGPGGLGTNGLIDVTGGTFEMNGGEVYTGTFQRSGGGVFNFNDGKLTVAGGTFDPGAAAYTINGPSVAELPTLVLADGATAPGVTSTMIVGNTNRGRLEILNGSTLNSADPDLGSTSSGYGEAVVDGAGSTWTISSGDIVVGEGGTGDLTVSNGGLVTAGDDFVVGRGGISDGTLLVSSGASVSAANRMVIGESGTGMATVEGGGSMTSSSYLNMGWFSGSNGTLTATGSGSLIDANSSLNVGGIHSGAGGTGELNISNDATVDVATNLRVWSAGTVNFSGGTVIASTINDTSGGAFNFTGGDLHVGTYDGNLIQDGGTMSPGASPGTTFITGNYDINAGTYLAEFGGGGNPTDLVDVTGDINISLVGTSLDLLPIGGMDAGTYTLMETTGGTLTGTFDNVTDLGVYDDLFGVQYTATSVTLTLDFGLIAGDLNLDGFVDAADAGLMFGNWGPTTLGYLDGNLNGDAYIDAADAGIMFGNWTGDVGPALTTIPEPSALLLAGLAGCTLLGRRRRI